MNKSKIITITGITLLFFVLSPMFAADGVRVSIRLYDQRIYFPGDPIEVRITISNESADTFRFKLADRRLHNLDFDVRGMDNSAAEPSSHFITKINDSQRVSYRDVDLLPGEELSFIEDLSEYRSLENGIYMVHARFFPELRDVNGQDVLNSNTLTISVREGFRREEASQIRVAETVQEQMLDASLAPDEVVAYMLEARMHSNREMFLQYLDVESLYVDQPQNEASYRRLSAMERRDTLQEYREELWNSATPEGISLIPLNYVIQQTNYSPNRGTVTVEQRYNMGSFIEIKRFTYELERRDSIWYIVRYQVINLGTE